MSVAVLFVGLASLAVSLFSLRIAILQLRQSATAVVDGPVRLDWDAEARVTSVTAARAAAALWGGGLFARGKPLRVGVKVVRCADDPAGAAIRLGPF